MPSISEVESPYLKAADVAAHLGVTCQHVYNLVEAGRLDALKIPSAGESSRVHYRIHKDALAKFEAERSTAPEPERVVHHAPRRRLENMIPPRKSREA